MALEHPETSVAVQGVHLLAEGVHLPSIHPIHASTVRLRLLRLLKCLAGELQVWGGAGEVVIREALKP